MTDPSARAPAPGQPPAKRFGRFALTELVGRSHHTMAWRTYDPRLQRDFLLVMPRTPATSSDQLQQWQIVQDKVGRLRHPMMAPLVEAGHHEGWPFALYDHAGSGTLADLIGTKPLLTRVAVLAAQGLGEALAAAHQAGLVHGDPQPYLVLKDTVGPARWIGLGVAFNTDPNQLNEPGSHAAAVLAESDRLRVLRDLAQRDVLALGLLLYHALTGQPALDEADTGRVIARMLPLGRELVRVPWSTPQPIPEGLRAIVNRAADRQPRQRYRSVRSLLHALEGWLKADESEDGSALELLRDRLGKYGLLPASPGIAESLARMARMERKRTHELAAVVLQDIGLTLDALKAVNVAKARSGELAESGPVLTLRSAIALLGTDRIRRSATALRAWPGILGEAPAKDLKALMQATHQAMRLAKALRPPAWQSEVVAVATLLQQLGKLLVQYHFPDDMTQIRRLMQPGPAIEPDGKEESGMSEQSAAFTVLGVDMETLAGAAVRPWGLGDEVQQLMRRMPLDAKVHPPSSDDEFLRALASCAHETIEARLMPANKVPAAMAHVVKRYGRALELSHKRLLEALVEANAPEKDTAAVTEVLMK
jgi:non-specific serine/threonine protein kinase